MLQNTREGRYNRHQQSIWVDNMFQKQISNETQRKYETILSELYRLIKFHNSQSLLGINPEDLRDLARNLEADHELVVVQQAYQDIAKNYANKSLTIGVFLEKVTAHQKNHDMFNAPVKESETKPGVLTAVKPSETVFTEMKRLAKSAVKTLPYDKDSRSWARSLSEEEKRQVEANPDRTQELIKDLISYGLTLGLCRSLISAHGEKHVRRSMIAYTRLGGELLANKEQYYPCSMYDFIANHLVDTSDEAVLAYNQSIG